MRGNSRLMKLCSGLLVIPLVAACSSAATPSVSAPTSAPTPAPSVSAPTAAPSVSAPTAAPSVSGTPVVSASGKTYNIYLSNSYLGNDWRVQMVKTAELAAATAPLLGRVNLVVENSENSVSAQIASLNNIIALKPDAILVDPASPTGLNPTLAAACAAGILIVSFDTVDTAPCSYQVGIDFDAASQLGASWMAKTLNGKGQLFEDTGLAGYATSQLISGGWAKVLPKYPSLTVEGTYQGNYAPGPEQQGVSSLLAAHPQVDGILTQGYCTGAMAALKNAGHAAIPMYCQAYNGTLLAALQQNYPIIATADPPYLSADALLYAVQILDGNKPSSMTINTPIACFVSNNVQPDGATCATIATGVNTFSDLAPGLTLPVSPDWTAITAQEFK
jgi:ribose transport system substrate-binding protein